MKNKLCCGILALALLAGGHQSVAQGTRFFRISGPAATKITARTGELTCGRAKGGGGGVVSGRGAVIDAFVVAVVLLLQNQMIMM